MLSTFITNAMVHGANRPFNVAVLVADLDTLKKWAAERGLDTRSIPELLKRPEVQQLYREQINEQTRGFKGYEKPQAFLLLGDDFTVANNMLTATMKLRRRGVLDRYGDAIDALYQEAHDGALPN